MSEPVVRKRSLFRKAALERMAAPERLNVAARIVRPTAWLLLAAAARRFWPREELSPRPNSRS